jgi:hypothetical protein
MLTLEQAKELQSKRSKACVGKLCIFVLTAAVVWFVIFFFTEYLTVAVALSCVLLCVGIRVSKLPAFLQKKEFVGTVIDSNIKMVTARRYGASNQPGTTYAASEVPVLEITVENDAGKRICKETPYQWAWGEFKPGMQVCLLRMIDQPIKM